MMKMMIPANEQVASRLRRNTCTKEKIAAISTGITEHQKNTELKII